MRLFIAVIFLIVVPMTLREMAVPAAASESAEKGISLYDPNPAHIWNRLYDALLLREDPAGGRYGEDSLDPLLWLNSEHLLAQPSHQRALRVLDEFLQTHAENQIHDPAMRVLLGVLKSKEECRSDGGGPGTVLDERSQVLLASMHQAAIGVRDEYDFMGLEEIGDISSERGYR